MGDGGADAQSHMRCPACVLPSIHGARENLIETVGELHDIEGIADAIPGPDGNAVARTRDADNSTLLGDDLSVVIINHQSPIRVVVEPVDAASAPVRGRIEGGAVPRHAVQPHVSAVWLIERDVAVEALAEATIKGGLKLCTGGISHKCRCKRGESRNCGPTSRS